MTVIASRKPLNPFFADVTRDFSFWILRDSRAREALKKMASYLGAGLAMLVTGLAPDVIMVVGEVTHLWEHVEPVHGEF